MAILCSVKTIEKSYINIIKDLKPFNAKLIAVSKLQSVADIQELYNLGHRDFGENYVQECCEKQEKLPADIHWHFIGHLQSNKVKNISPFINLIQSVDSFKLLKEINKQASKQNRIQDVLIQIHIAMEETKFGFSIEEAEDLFESKELENLTNIKIKGFMAMASFSEDKNLIRKEFSQLKAFNEKICNKYAAYSKQLKLLSMGMTSDYQIALEEGSNMVRIGSALFGERKKTE